MTDIRRKRLFWFIGLSVAGVLDSIWLLMVHMSPDSFGGMCTLGSVFSCEVAKATAYSEWIQIPVPVYSILFYVTGITLAVRAIRRPQGGTPEIAALWVMAIMGLAISLYMASVAIFTLHSFCPFCGILYAIHIGLIVVAWKLFSELQEPSLVIYTRVLRKGLRRPAVWVALVSGIGLVEGLHSYFVGRSVLSKIVVPLKAEELRTKGNPQAKKMLVEFSDFQCPFCKVAASVLKDVEHDMRNEVRVTYKFFPLDQSCNPYGGAHKQACDAAFAAFCASLQGKFWEYHDLLFSSQEDLPGWRLQSFARELNLDAKNFESCMNDDQAKQAIRNDIEEGNSLEVHGTPSIFIDGRRYSGAITVSALKSALQE